MVPFSPNSECCYSSPGLLLPALLMIINPIPEPLAIPDLSLLWAELPNCGYSVTSYVPLMAQDPEDLI